MRIELPPTARAKLAALRQSALDADALAAAAATAIQRLEVQLEGARQRDAARRNFVPFAPSDDRDDGDDTPEPIEEEAPFVEAELERARVNLARRQSRSASDKQTAARVEHWLDALPAGTVLESVGVPITKLRDGETLPVAIERIRGEIEERQRQLKALQRAPLPADELKANARAYVERLAASAAPAFHGLNGGEFSVTLAPAAPALSVPVAELHALRMMAWVAPAALTARLEAAIDALPSDPNALGSDDRRRRAEELERHILELERDEEHFVSAALATGQDVARRRRADPRAVLGVEIAGRRAKAA